MEYIEREIQPHLLDMATWFPIVFVGGARQCGKTTLLQKAFADYHYLNLDNDVLAESASTDPLGFLERHGSHLILDEVQRVPELFPALKVVVDKTNGPGQFIISGSQNFLLMESITQSLAGRVGILHLSPLSFREIDLPIDDFILKGGYPRLHNSSGSNIPLRIYFESYVNTYLERDVRTVGNVVKLDKFRRLLSLSANYAGNLVNYTKLANSVGSSFNGIKRWLGILEASYIVFTLQPFAASMEKRVTKTPKLYFWDTGLLCHLLGIHTTQELATHPDRGAIFENFVIAETAKNLANQGAESNLFFYRDAHKTEVDLVSGINPQQLTLSEIKASVTPRPRFADAVNKVAGELGVDASRRQVIYQGSEDFVLDEVRFIPVETYLYA